MTPQGSTETVLKRLGLVVRLTQFGMLAEQVTRCFWPVWTLGFAVLATLMLGGQDVFGVEVVWGVGVIACLLTLVLLVRGGLKFRWPTRDAALLRLDATLPGRPIQALKDHPAIGAKDAGSQAIWRAHQARMAVQAQSAKRVSADLRIARLDPFGLRFLAVIAICVALLFGSFAKIGSVTELSVQGAAGVGPSWEGWIEAPVHTGRPTIYLNDLPEGSVDLSQDSKVVLRLYGRIGDLTVAETVSGRSGDLPSAAEPEQEFMILHPGELRIDGPGGRIWDVGVIQDNPPSVRLSAAVETSARGEMSLPFAANDDYGVTGGQATITLDLAAVTRHYGLGLPPETRPAILAELPLPISGDRRAFQESLIENYSQHPWAHLPVIISLKVWDAANQARVTEPVQMILPARRFFDPLAAAVIELRRDLLWNSKNAPRIADLLRAMSHRPQDGAFQEDKTYLRYRAVMRHLEAYIARGLTAEMQGEMAQAFWDLAIVLEEGDLGDALERLRRAQDRLSEAMKNGANEAEIAQLMQELRDATQDYMRELARTQDGPEDGDTQSAENALQMDQADLQRMMDRIQELMEQGRMAEAQQALNELQQLMENMQVTRNQGQGEPTEGEQAMQDLSGTLKEQQDLSDQAFRELQEQFNSGENSSGWQENPDRQGEQGGDQGQEQGQPQDGTGQGAQGQGDQVPSGREALADRQQALRQELQRQQGRLPGAGTPEGDATRDALGRAGQAMDEAEKALRQDDLATAIDQQSAAMEALRDGMRTLGDAIAQQQIGEDGDSEGDTAMGQDPLGRNPGGRGRAQTDDGLLQGEDVYRQARKLLDEIRKRAGEAARPEVEREYLRRLLDRF